MKAVALISGGLDSLLAAKYISKEGIEVLGLKFKMPFGVRSVRGLPDPGIEIREIDICDEFLKMLEHPAHGYGSFMNPCIDCKILMLRKAKEIMEQEGAGFLVTGEVLGQRPMSQQRETLKIIAKAAGLEGLLLRPLSARLLDETIPEKKGWVKRGNLLDFSGRGRKAQIELAAKLGIREYAQPAGGCLLTDPSFSRRLKDLMNHEKLTCDGVELLKIGRHFRLKDNAKLIVGRNEKENEQLLGFARESDYVFMPGSDLAGPTSLGRGAFDDELIRLSCAVTSSYCDLEAGSSADILYKSVSGGIKGVLKVMPLAREMLSVIRI